MDFFPHGVDIRRNVLAEEDIQFVIADISLDSDLLRQGGIRNLEKKFASIARLVADTTILDMASSLLDGTPQLVRALFFDKTPEKNWFVAWHQDKIVTLNKKAAMAGWGPWSVKDGVCHVQPPCAVLDHMLTIRLHVDPADEYSGCLKVMPGTHRLGILQQTEIDRIATSRSAVECVVSAGDAVIMRPHVLHASSRSTRRSHRRVIHLEYSDYKLPQDISWA
ncbi:MAG: phytanoyl-CoA dioxygenase family protein [Steroidobacteraceae bacterium]